MGLVKAAQAEYQFFSVKKPVNFGGRVYRPSICYKLTSDILPTVVALAEAGGAECYTEAVRFLSGRAHKVTAHNVAQPVLVGPSMDTGVTVSGPKQKKAREQSSSAHDGTGEFVDGADA